MSNLACTREECQSSETGKCLEGFEPVETCPYLATDKELPASESATSDGNFVNLPSGEGISDMEAFEVARHEETVVVVIAGPSESGKTTILTSLFDSFQEAPFGRHLFAGSNTLIGFERRCHDARTESNRRVSHTLHTRVTEHVEVLHLRLVNPQSKRRHPWSLLLSDISGERFKAMRDSTAAVLNTKLLGRADHFCLTLDAGLLSREESRHTAFYDSRMMLRSVLEASVLPVSCRISVLLTKWDIVKAIRETGALVDYLNNCKAVLEGIATDAGMCVDFFEVAARPESPTVPFAFGLPTLLRRWSPESKERTTPRLYVPANLKAVGSELFINAELDSLNFRDHYDVRTV